MKSSKTKIKLKVAVLVSGGADSAFALLESVKKYSYVESFTFSFSRESTCCNSNDISNAKAHSALLGVKHNLIDLNNIFYENIIKYTEDEYKIGRTPNPCVVCNKKVKIERFIKEVCPHKFDKVITGHFAKIERFDNRYCISMANNKLKDQSYFLARLDKNIIRYLELPCGIFSKEHIRQTLKTSGFTEHDKAESQDLCFADCSEYLLFKKELSIPGNIYHINDNKLIGRHNGIINYTYGQRKGLGISWDEPLYVVKIDPENNAIYVGEREFIYSNKIEINHLNWICSHSPNNMEGLVKIRSFSTPVSAKFDLLDKDHAQIIPFKELFAVTPGQLAVFYINNSIAVSGWIQ